MLLHESHSCVVVGGFKTGVVSDPEFSFSWSCVSQLSGASKFLTGGCMPPFKQQVNNG